MRSHASPHGNHRGSQLHDAARGASARQRALVGAQPSTQASSIEAAHRSEPT
jgi:hypothetical protein